MSVINEQYAEHGWEYKLVDFKAERGESNYCICDACHKTGEVMKLTLPETAYYRNGQLSTKYREYWLCPPCRRKLVHALDWPEDLSDGYRERTEHNLQ